MKIGITVPNNWGVEDVRDVVALGQSAEQLGFDSIWTMDHLLNIGFVRDRQIHRSAQHRHGSTAARKKWSTPSAITAAWVSSTWSWRPTPAT